MKTNENKICARIVIEIKARLASPLLIGSGEDGLTDRDQIRTADGIPFVPGSALAGVMRSYLEEKSDRQEAADLFGTLGWIQQKPGKRKESEGTVDRQSRIYVYDALLTDYTLTRRDGIRLDEKKTTEDRLKFDMEAVEPGARLRMRLEILIREQNIGNGLEAAVDKDLKKIRCCVCGMRSGGLRLGARGRRGFGKLEVQSARHLVFRMDTKKDFEKWLEWDWNSDSAFKESDKWNLREGSSEYTTGEHHLHIPLKVKNTILIRDYGSEEYLQVDYGYLALRDGTPVIPGSSWAGAARNYVAGIVRQIGGLQSWEQAQKALEPFWGTWISGKKESLCASRLIFDETQITGGHSLTVQRNSVDRFTGGSAQGALFDETVWVGGNADLHVCWSEKKMNDNEQNIICGMLLWVVFGLKNGFLTVGGETAIGRGILELSGEIRLDGKPIENEDKYLKAAADWCKCKERDKNGKEKRS